MLVLSRKLNQGIKIGDSVNVTVGLLQSDRVQLAIEAPGLLVLRDDAGPDVGKQARSGRLVLTRRCKQSISIGDHIVVVVEHITRKRVRLGIEAPRKMRILRSELQDLPPSGTPLPKRKAS